MKKVLMSTILVLVAISFSACSQKMMETTEDKQIHSKALAVDGYRK